MIDAATRREITFAVQSAIHKTMCDYEEVWLSEKELLRQFQFLNKGWLKEFGELLPRTQAIVIRKNGKERTTGWAYPRNKIQSMLMNGNITVNENDKKRRANKKVG